ncbi:CPBP family intramembrane glutamic endopeptidase [Paenibacillus thiaminolyticus]|uniref:CPBP family intramembrane glutamic endopeptidase n=1 Tax=Paenibacillus thiaminolyticus TaxID=49283 RepID=UPI003D29FD0C
MSASSTDRSPWKKETGLYTALVLGLTLAANLSGRMELIGISQAAPLIAVLLLLLLRPGRKDTLRRTGITRFGKPRWYIVVLLAGLPVAAGFAAAWAVGYVSLPAAQELGGGMTVPAYIQLVTLNLFKPNLFIVMTLLFAFGEEIGWRGYLQPKLTEMLGVRKAILITAAVWAVFHYPFYLNGYNDDGMPLITIALFTAMIFPLSIVMGWVRYASGSIWPAVLIHTVINHSRYWLEVLFYHKQSGWTYIAGESGAVTLLIWCLAALFIWRALPGRERNNASFPPQGNRDSACGKKRSIRDQTARCRSRR